MEAKDRHHLLWTRRKWRKDFGGKLRSHWYLRVPISVSLHRFIHENMSGIPRCNEALCESALIQLDYLSAHQVIHKDDTLEQRLQLLIAILDTGQSPTCEALRRELSLAKTFRPP